MKFTYKDQKYDLVDPISWTTLEAIKLEQYTGMRMRDLMREFAGLNPMGVHATVWVSLRRAGKDVAWDELDLPHVETLDSFEGEPVEGTLDPSTASTAEPKAASRTPSAKTSRQRKK